MGKRPLTREPGCTPAAPRSITALSSLVASLGFAATCAASAAAPPPRAAPSPTASGEAVYERWCAPCHAPGPGHPGTQSLQVKYGGRIPAVLLERTDLSARAVTRFVREGVLSMTPFRKTEITDAELSALARYVARRYKGP
jgi:mono/diheme cytochrome c family protein